MKMIKITTLALVFTIITSCASPSMFKHLRNNEPNPAQAYIYMRTYTEVEGSKPTTNMVFYNKQLDDPKLTSGKAYLQKVSNYTYIHVMEVLPGAYKIGSIESRLRNAKAKIIIDSETFSIKAGTC